MLDGDMDTEMSRGVLQDTVRRESQETFSFSLLPLVLMGKS